jgi:hypothetical protein
MAHSVMKASREELWTHPYIPQAALYVKPSAAPFEFGTETLTLKELLSAPAMSKVLYTEIPGLKLALQGGLEAHVSNFTLHDVMTFGMLSLESIAKIDAQLRALPVSERPSL